VIYHASDQDIKFLYLSYLNKNASFHLFKVYQNKCEAAEMDEFTKKVKLYGPLKHLAEANFYQNTSAKVCSYVLNVT
jgi:hypothetical protein